MCVCQVVHVSVCVSVCVCQVVHVSVSVCEYVCVPSCACECVCVSVCVCVFVPSRREVVHVSECVCVPSRADHQPMSHSCPSLADPIHHIHVGRLQRNLLRIGLFGKKGSEQRE